MRSGDIADARGPDERQEVVLADGPERYRVGDHQLVVSVVVVEDGRLERLGGEEFLVRLHHPPGRVPHDLLVVAGPESHQHLARRLLRRLHILYAVGRQGFLAVDHLGVTGQCLLHTTWSSR